MPIPDRTEFELKGWYIKIPYISWMENPKDVAGDEIPVRRTTLEPRDFKEPIDPKMIHYDKAHRIYYIGVNPFAAAMPSK